MTEHKIAIRIEPEDRFAANVIIRCNDYDSVVLRIFEKGVMVFVDCLSMTREFEVALADDGGAIAYRIADRLRQKLPWYYAEPVLQGLYGILRRKSICIPSYPLDVRV